MLKIPFTATVLNGDASCLVTVSVSAKKIVTSQKLSAAERAQARIQIELELSRVIQKLLKIEYEAD